MMELGPHARSLIELARREDDPDQAARERVHEALCARLNSGLPAGSNQGAEYAGLQRVLTAKSAALLAVFGAALGGGWAVYSQHATTFGTGTPSSSSTAAVASPPGAGHGFEPEPVALGAGAKTATSGVRAESADSSPGRAQAPRTTAAAAGRGSAPPERASDAPPAEPRNESKGRRELEPGARVERSALSDAAPAEEKQRDSNSDSSSSSGGGIAPTTSANEALLAEARALREVQKLLRDGNSARALALLALQDRQFGNGQLSEARAAARAMAVCSNQSAEGRRNTTSAFEARWPRSILLSSVRSACESSEHPSSKARD